MLMAKAVAPSNAMNWPLMLPPPSYVMSLKRLTTPIMSTKVKAGEAKSNEKRRRDIIRDFGMVQIKVTVFGVHSGAMHPKPAAFLFIPYPCFFKSQLV